MYLNITFAFVLLFSGCSAPPPKPNVQPGWVNNPYISHKVAAVGSAQIHYYGKVAQRKLAISRALDELASQQGVKVSSLITRHDRRNGSQVSGKSDIYSFQTSDNKIVHAHIEDTWTDPLTEEFFVWMVAD